MTTEELTRAKAQLKGSLMLSLESSMARMSNLARQEMYYDRFYGMNEITERIEAVQVEDVQKVAGEFFVAGPDCSDGSGKPERAENFTRPDRLLAWLVPSLCKKKEIHLDFLFPFEVKRGTKVYKGMERVTFFVTST